MDSDRHARSTGLVQSTRDTGGPMSYLKLFDLFVAIFEVTRGLMLLAMGG